MSLTFAASRHEADLKDDMPSIRSYLESVERQTLGIGVRIMLALLLVAAMGFVGKLYVVQEILVVLLLLAIPTVTVFVFVVAFILLQEGVRRAVLWAKSGVLRVVRVVIGFVGGAVNLS